MTRWVAVGAQYEIPVEGERLPKQIVKKRRAKSPDFSPTEAPLSGGQLLHFISVEDSAGEGDLEGSDHPISQRFRSPESRE